MSYELIPLVDSATKLFPQPTMDALAAALPGATPDEIATAVDAYLTENPVSVGEELVQSSPQGSWVFTHSLGRKPSVTVYLDTGEQILAPVVADDTRVTISFANPTSGSAVLI